MIEYANVKILPNNINKKVLKGSKLIDVIYENKIHIDAVCSGKGKCGKCRVKLLQGNISKTTENEKKFLSKIDIDNNTILACEKIITDDITIELSSKKEENPMNKGYVKKNNSDKSPIITKKFHKLNPPSLNDQVSDIDRILRELDANIEIDINIISKVNSILKESNYNITTTIFDNELINIEKGDCTQKNYAIAIDLGTTTVAGYLVDINKKEVINTYSNSNLQKSHGADVISRINYCIESDENLSKLKNLAIETIDIIINKLLEISNIEKEDINVITILCNTVMSHLLIGVTPIGIARVPFAPVFNKTIKGNIDFLGLRSLNKETKFILLPNIAGYVGSDTLGVIISTDILNKRGNYLAIDIGTNCELVLKTDEKILTCSTAAGPAFEGANMSCGMRAESGAIYTCDIGDDIYVKTIENKEPLGICGSGFIDIVAKLLQNNLIKKQGRILSVDRIDPKISPKIKNRIKKVENSYKIVLNDGENDVSITQLDISNLQLAKGAVMSGIEIMMKEAGVNSLDKIFLAGAFGSNLNKESLKIIKMIPKIEDKKIEVVGNAAGSGAIEVLLSKDIYENLIDIANCIEHIELANHKDFQNKFVKSMMF